MGRFFDDDDPTRRFLVADETGLGKSMVARGVIASVIERLQDDASVNRIDIVYVCSNADIAQQNIARLDVTGEPHLPFASRLTLLAKESGRLAQGCSRFLKPVNLVSFTPGTSFDMGWRTGKAEERALLYLLLAEHLKLSAWPKKAAAVLLQGTVASTENFLYAVNRLQWELKDGPPDEVVAASFIDGAEAAGLIGEFSWMLDEIGRRRSLHDELRSRAWKLTGKLRAELARASIATLEPDLVILDEFQRFRHLLDREHGGDAAELAHHLFNYGDARVLLLSATPYKPFTYAEESAGGDDHYRDLRQTLKFLADGSPDAVENIAGDLAEYRQVALSARDPKPVRDRLQQRLLKLMCRTERPQLGEHGMLVERSTPADAFDRGRPVRLRHAPQAGHRRRGSDAPRLLEVGPLLRQLPRGLPARRQTADGPQGPAANRGAPAAPHRHPTDLLGRRPLLPASRIRQRPAAASGRGDRRGRLVAAPVDAAVDAVRHPRRPLCRPVCAADHQAARLLVMGGDADGHRLPPQLRGRTPHRPGNPPDPQHP